VQAVRRDPAERAALQARLAEYEAQEAPLREAREALLAANKQQAGSLTAEAKLAALQERRAKEEERLLLVRDSMLMVHRLVIVGWFLTSYLRPLQSLAKVLRAAACSSIQLQDAPFNGLQAAANGAPFIQMWCNCL
jgi:hypothetical protein